jgi:hypothetical protein
MSGKKTWSSGLSASIRICERSQRMCSSSGMSSLRSAGGAGRAKADFAANLFGHSSETGCTACPFITRLGIYLAGAVLRILQALRHPRLNGPPANPGRSRWASRVENLSKGREQRHPSKSDYRMAARIARSSMDHKHRHRGVDQQLLGKATEHPFPEAAVAVAAHDEEPDLLRCRGEQSFGSAARARL